MDAIAPAEQPLTTPGTEQAARRNGLLGACLAHLLHDGYTDQLYALLPIWQSQFGLSYAGLAVLRALYFGTMGGLQVPADRMTAGLGPRAALAAATVTAAAGFLVMALPLGLPGLCLGLVLAGIGSSVQHPRASTLVTHAYGSAARGPLGTYNFSGDLGKAVFPALVAMALPILAWRTVVGITAGVGIGVTLALLLLLPARPFARGANEARPAGSDGRGFGLLLAIGAFDTAPRMGYLLFLPFLLHGKGGGETSVAVGLASLFLGGALGKACCGWVGQRFGVVRSVVATEAATAVLMLATLALPLAAMPVVLPVLGVVLNGTSSVLYGTVPDLARKGRVGRAFALFYTGVIGAGGIAPIAYGAIADLSSRAVGVAASAMTAVAVIPMVLALGPHLRRARGGPSGDPA